MGPGKGEDIARLDEHQPAQHGIDRLAHMRDDGVDVERSGFGLAPAPDHLHAACVQMVRADYCGDGRSHTQGGTLIQVYDDLGVQRRRPPSSEDFTFKAGWTAQGAACVAHPRWRELGNIQELLTDELASGRLVQPFDTILDAGAYYLTYPAKALDQPRPRLFIQWLLHEAGL